MDDRHVTVVIGSKKLDLDLDEIFYIDETDITKDMVRQSSLYAYFATLAAEAEYISSMREHEAEQEYAAADQQYRKLFAERDEKVTESMIRQIIVTDEGYVEKIKRSMQTKYQYKKIKAITDAMNQRASMLISLGAFLRHEAELDGMNIRRREYDNVTEKLKGSIKHERDDKS